jgi:hypothetical protein
MLEDSSNTKINDRLLALESEMTHMRESYMVINQKYVNALSSLKHLTAHAGEAAVRSSKAAEFAATAAKHSALAAQEAGSQFIAVAAEAAAQAAAATKIATEAAREAQKMSNAAIQSAISSKRSN